jgi:lysophospholipase L1-like esterase
MSKTYRYLALGDSYTAAEGLPIYDSFPYQAVQQLRRGSYAFEAPEVVAKSGWTMAELLSAAEVYQFLPNYDVVTLLAGVNNQYRGQTVESCKQEFEDLLSKAIKLAHDKNAHVLVLSIPDYARTPYAEQLDRAKISREIELFNSMQKALCIQYKVAYADVAGDTNGLLGDPANLATDQLHPAAFVYAQWATRVADFVKQALK